MATRANASSKCLKDRAVCVSSSLGSIPLPQEYGVKTPWHDHTALTCSATSLLMASASCSCSSSSPLVCGRACSSSEDTRGEVAVGWGTKSPHAKIGPSLSVLARVLRSRLKPTWPRKGRDQATGISEFQSSASQTWLHAYRRHMKPWLEVMPQEDQISVFIAPLTET